MYWSSDPKILWGIVEKHLPALKMKVDGWIGETERPLRDPAFSENGQKKENKLSRKLRELADREPPTENKIPQDEKDS
jgi:hypothetical protein